MDNRETLTMLRVARELRTAELKLNRAIIVGVADSAAYIDGALAAVRAAIKLVDSILED